MNYPSKKPLSRQQQYNWWDRNLPCRPVFSLSPCTIIQQSNGKQRIKGLFSVASLNNANTRKRKMINHRNNDGSFQKKVTLTHLKNLEQLKCLTIPQLLNPKTTYLYSNSSLTLDEVFFKKEIHNEIFDRLNNFIGDMIIKEGVNWNLLSQRY